MAASNHVELEGRDRSHARVGAGLLTRWNLPERIVHAVEYHHSIVDSSVSPLAKLVIAGHAFTAELGANGPEPAVSMIEAMHMLRLDIRPASIVEEIEEELVSITNVLELVR
jgi:HD-like signal output (HDOD) protein